MRRSPEPNATNYRTLGFKSLLEGAALRFAAPYFANLHTLLWGRRRGPGPGPQCQWVETAAGTRQTWGRRRLSAEVAANEGEGFHRAVGIDDVGAVQAPTPYKALALFYSEKECCFV